eukprot:m51a1_g3925 hypothetical protein (164) ;mRNA; f:189775-190266
MDVVPVQQWAVCERCFWRGVAVWDVLFANGTGFVSVVGVCGGEFFDGAGRPPSDLASARAFWGAHSNAVVDGGVRPASVLSLFQEVFDPWGPGARARLVLDCDAGELYVGNMTRRGGRRQRGRPQWHCVGVPAGQRLWPAVCIIGNQVNTLRLVSEPLDSPGS